MFPSELKVGDVYYEAGRGQLIKMTVHTEPKEFVYDKSQYAWSVIHKGEEMFFNVVNNFNTPIQLYVMLPPDPNTEKKEKVENN